MSKNIESFVFFDSSSSGQESNVFYNSSNGTDITIQVSGLATGATCNLKFQGRSDLDADFVDLAMIDLTTLDVVDKITTNGIFTFSVVGVSACKAVCTSGVGTIKVYGVLIEQ